MSVSSPVMYRGMYVGDMDEKRIKAILDVISLDCVPELLHMIYDFPMDIVMDSIDQGISPRQLVADRKLDIRDYIGELRDYQTVGTAFLYLSPRSIIGDQVGLGKTIICAALINFLKAKNEMKRFLIAADNRAVAQTLREIIRFTGLRVIILPSDKAHMKRCVEKLDWRNVDGIVTAHTALKSDYFSNWLALNINKTDKSTCKIFDVLFIDESSVVKNTKTRMFTYTQNVCNLCKRVHMMNATPFENIISDIYNQVDILHPSLLPRRYKIEKEFCEFNSTSFYKKGINGPQLMYARKLSGYKNQEVFKQRLKMVYFGRSSQMVGIDPGRHTYRLYCDIEPSANQKFAIANGNRYIEVLNCPSLIPDIGIKTNRQEVPKIDRLVTMVENEFIDKKVMVYCFHIEAQYAIKAEVEKLGRRVVVLNGDCNMEQKIEAQTGFNGDKYDVIITNIKKSLNLDSADACIFYSLETNPAGISQIAGRIDRNTTNKLKTFIMLLYKDSDEYNFFMETVRQRALDLRDLTLPDKNVVDYFIDSMGLTYEDILNKQA